MSPCVSDTPKTKPQPQTDRDAENFLEPSLVALTPRDVDEARLRRSRPSATTFRRRRRRCVVVVKNPKQAQQFSPLRWSQRRQGTVLRPKEADPQALKAGFARNCHLDDVLAAVGRVGNARDDAFGLKSGNNRIHVAAVDICPPAEFCLRNSSKRIDRSEHGQLVAMGSFGGEGFVDDATDENSRLIEQAGGQIAPERRLV